MKNLNTNLAINSIRFIQSTLLLFILTCLFNTNVYAGTAPTITFTIQPHTYGSGTFTLVAYSNSTGKITFSSGNTALATCTGTGTQPSSGSPANAGQTTAGATCTIISVGGGSVNITANQAAVGTTWNAASKVASLTINKATPVFTFPEINVTYGDANFTLPGALFSSTSPGAVTFASTDNSVFTISGNTVHIVGIGFAQVDASQVATANYNALSQYAVLNVHGISPSFTYLINDTTVNYTTSPFNITDPVSNSLGTFTYTSLDPTIATVSGNQVTTTGAGTVSIICTQAADGIYAEAIISFSITVLDDQITQVWTGAISTDWYDPNNWSNTKVPLNNTGNANIPSGPTNQPVLSNNVNINDITLNGNLSINGYSFGFGNLITGTGFLKGSATSSLSVTSPYENTIKFGSSATDSILKNLTLYLGQVTLANGLGITGVLGVYGATLNTGNHLTLISNAEGTASVDDVTGGGNFTGSVINGGVTVQRYHSNKRDWNMITAPLTMSGANASCGNGSIATNWQQQTLITAPSQYTQYGLDLAPNNNYTMLNWTGKAWGYVTNTSAANTLIGNAGGSVADNKPFFIYIRGDRSVAATLGGTGHSSVVLQASGVLQTGNKSFDISNIATNGYAFVANPYPAPISVAQLLSDNPTLSTNSNTFIYYWDASISSSGGYTTLTHDGGSWVGGNSLYIQSGQAFFVTKTATATEVLFKEGQKSIANSSNTVFGTTSSYIKIGLNKGASFVDGVMTMYNNKYSAAVIAPTEDAYKFWGNEENVAILRTGSYLSVEARPEITGADTTFLYMNKMVAGNTYTFTIAGTNMPKNITGVLVDKYINSSVALDLTNPTNISFTIDTAAASKSATRFYIVFNYKAPLSVSAMKIKATAKESAAVVSWTVAAEKDVNNYIVERSTNGVAFESIHNTIANNSNNSNYSYTDNLALAGNNFYRIKVINMDGTVQYSEVVKVIIADKKEGISIYPNPIVGRTMHLQLNNLTAGIYTLTMFTADGQQVLEQSIACNGESLSTTIQLPVTIATGIYQVNLSGTNKKFNELVLVK